jgi:hypothetical protein
MPNPHGPEFRHTLKIRASRIQSKAKAGLLGGHFLEPDFTGANRRDAAGTLRVADHPPGTGKALRQIARFTDI